MAMAGRAGQTGPSYIDRSYQPTVGLRMVSENQKHRQVGVHLLL